MYQQYIQNYPNNPQAKSNAYSIALNLNPRNLPGREGLHKLKQMTDTVSERIRYEIASDEGGNSCDELDLEGSKTEAICSEGDLTPAPTSNRTF